MRRRRRRRAAPRDRPSPVILPDRPHGPTLPPGVKLDAVPSGRGRGGARRQRRTVARRDGRTRRPARRQRDVAHDRRCARDGHRRAPGAVGVGRARCHDGRAARRRAPAAARQHVRGAARRAAGRRIRAACRGRRPRRPCSRGVRPQRYRQVERDDRARRRRLAPAHRGPARDRDRRCGRPARLAGAAVGPAGPRRRGPGGGGRTVSRERQDRLAGRRALGHARADRPPGRAGAAVGGAVGVRADGRRLGGGGDRAACAVVRGARRTGTGVVRARGRADSSGPGVAAAVAALAGMAGRHAVAMLEALVD